MPTVYEQRVEWALRKKAEDAYLYRAMMGLGLRSSSVSEAGCRPLLEWAGRRARQLAEEAAQYRIPIAVFDAQLAALRALTAAALDVAAGAPLRRLERRIVPPVIPSGSTGAVRQALAQLDLDADPDTNVQHLVVALGGTAPRLETDLAPVGVAP